MSGGDWAVLIASLATVAAVLALRAWAAKP